MISNASILGLNMITPKPEPKEIGSDAYKKTNIIEVELY